MGISNNPGRWDASDFFEKLTERSLLAKREGFVFCRVSSLEGFEEALAQMTSDTAFVCVSDESNGTITLNTTPKSARVKTVFLAMRHPVDDMEYRQRCFDTMRELFRQFMSVLFQERTRLRENMLYIDEQIQYSEISRYFFSGAACAYFNIRADVMTDLRFNAADWDAPTLDDLIK